MGKYEQDARLLLEYVGGKENIAAVSHCVSRMRRLLLPVCIICLTQLICS